MTQPGPQQSTVTVPPRAATPDDPLPFPDFFPAPVYHALLQSALDQAQSDEAVIGALLLGSLARGDAHRGADMDLFYLLRKGAAGRAFVSETREGVLVEIHSGDRAHTAAKLEARPQLAYGFRDALILRDTEAGDLAAIQEAARQALRAYRTPPEERAATAYWLQSARIKINASLAAGDTLRAGYITATTSWKILEGLFAVNDLPVPPSGALLACVAELSQTPPPLPDILKRMFEEAGVTARSQAAVELIDWITTRLSDKTP